MHILYLGCLATNLVGFYMYTPTFCVAMVTMIVKDILQMYGYVQLIVTKCPWKKLCSL